MDFQALADYRNTHNPFCQQLGIHVDEIRLGYARTTKTVQTDDVNPMGTPHGGIYFTLADAACGCAIASHGCNAVTVNVSYQFMRSARVGDCLIAEASEVKHGKTISVFDVQVKNQSQQLLGTGTFTFYVVDQNAKTQ